MIRLKQVTDHPWFGASGWLIGAVGVALSVFFYFKSEQHREVIVTESSARATLIQRQRPSGLTVLYHDQPITDRDVISAQFTIWNAGTQSVRPENVLLPIDIRVDDATDLLDVSVSQATRPVVDPTVTRDAKDPRQVHLSFRILEPHDGFTVQLVYAGAPGAEFRWSGAVEGQPALYRLTKEQLKQAPKSFSERFWSLALGGGLAAFLCLGGLLVVRDALSISKSGVRPQPLPTKIGGTIFGAIVFTMGALIFYAVVRSQFLPAPPF